MKLTCWEMTQFCRMEKDGNFVLFFTKWLHNDVIELNKLNSFSMGVRFLTLTFFVICPFSSLRFMIVIKMLISFFRSKSSAFFKHYDIMFWILILFFFNIFSGPFHSFNFFFQRLHLFILFVSVPRHMKVRLSSTTEIYCE
jgi:hypothetical protein